MRQPALLHSGMSGRVNKPEPIAPRSASFGRRRPGTSCGSARASVTRWPAALGPQIDTGHARTCDGAAKWHDAPCLHPLHASQQRRTRRTFGARVVRVLIASPGDTGAARGLLRAVMEDWNSLHAEDTSVILLPVMWERDSTPAMGERPQAMINRQLVEAADVLVGNFWTRLGTPTGAAESGTVEEIELFIEAGKPVLLYFSNEPVIPSSVDLDEYRRLTEFKESLRRRGLYDEYAAEAELVRKVAAALTRTMRASFQDLMAGPLNDMPAEASSGPRAALVVNVNRERELRGFSKQGKPQYTTRHHLVVENRGTAAAEELVLEAHALEGRPDDHPPQIYGLEDQVSRLAPGGQLSFPLLVTMASASHWELSLRWTEDGLIHEEIQTVRG